MIKPPVVGGFIFIPIVPASCFRLSLCMENPAVQADGYGVY